MFIYWSNLKNVSIFKLIQKYYNAIHRAHLKMSHTKKYTLAEVENPAEGRTPDVGFIRCLAFIILHYFI
ncbi:MAG: hypothetical protein ACI85I_001250 [Arenicella sp.]|jgi:hypothetical protein